MSQYMEKVSAPAGSPPCLLNSAPTLYLLHEKEELTPSQCQVAGKGGKCFLFSDVALTGSAYPGMLESSPYQRSLLRQTATLH